MISLYIFVLLGLSECDEGGCCYNPATNLWAAEIPNIFSNLEDLASHNTPGCTFITLQGELDAPLKKYTLRQTAKVA